MTFSAPMPKFRTFQVLKNEKSNFRTFQHQWEPCLCPYLQYNFWIIIGSDRRPETKQGIEAKLLGSDREGLGIGLGLGILIADLNQIADLKLPILATVKFRSPI